MCTSCDRAHTAPHLLICAGCRRRAAADLAYIADAYPRLELRPGRRGNTTRGPVGFVSKPPLAVDVLSLQVAPAAALARPLAPVPARDTPDVNASVDTPSVTHADDPDRPSHAGAPTVVTLGRVADRCREAGILGPLRGPRTVLGEVLRLSGVLDRVAAAWWAGEVLHALRVAARDLRRALGEDERTVPIGTCPMPTGRTRVTRKAGRPVDIGPEVCDQALRARPGMRAVCPAGHRWEGEHEIRALGEHLGDAYLDLAALARYLQEFRPDRDAPSAQLMRKWAERDGWRRRKAGRRTLYRLADARDSAWRAWDRAHPVQGAAFPPLIGPEPAPVEGVDDALDAVSPLGCAA